MLLSIIIPAYNEARVIGRTLGKIKEALNEQSVASFQWEIIVCDNNSSDQTAEIAAQAGAKVVFEPINQISRARNTGAGQAKGEWLLFIDADSYPTPDLLKDVLDLIRQGRHIGCGATIKVEDGPLWSRLRAERLNPWMRLFKWCGGLFILCQREAFHQIGGFPLGLYAFEEIDFVFRLKRYGRRNGKRFEVLHRHPVITSGRKGELHPTALLTMFFSTVLAVLFFVLYYLLPKRFRLKGGSKLLGFWYNRRN